MKRSNSAEAEDSLVYSALCQRITLDGTKVDIQIYKDDRGGWLLEIVDEFWKMGICLTHVTTTDCVQLVIASRACCLQWGFYSSHLSHKPYLGASSEEDGEHRNLKDCMNSTGYLMPSESENSITALQ